jgi:hypothetical protein
MALRRQDDDSMKTEVYLCGTLFGKVPNKYCVGRFLARNSLLLTVARQPGIYTRFPFNHRDKEEYVRMNRN